MKLLLFDFECKTHGKFEELAKSDVRFLPCPICSQASTRTISPVRIDKLGMALQEGASPTSIDYFERVHKQRKLIENKSYEEHGDYGSHAGSDGGRPVTPQLAAAL